MSNISVSLAIFEDRGDRGFDLASPSARSPAQLINGTTVVFELQRLQFSWAWRGDFGMFGDSDLSAAMMLRPLSHADFLRFRPSRSSCGRVVQIPSGTPLAFRVRLREPAA
jgi:hypothetical protein